MTRIGETRVMNNGLRATIIAYRKITDVDIQFENGEISRSKTYGQFQRKMIKCPMVIERIGDYARVTNLNVSPALSFLIDYADIPALGDKFWHIGSRGYVQGKINGKKKLLHRHIMNAPDDVLIDHRDGNKLDCRRQNLRLCTNAENLRNQGKQRTNTSGYKGVCWDRRKGKWKAHISIGNKDKHIGYFPSKEDAAIAYNSVALEHHGEFAKLNDV